MTKLTASKSRYLQNFILFLSLIKQKVNRITEYILKTCQNQHTISILTKWRKPFFPFFVDIFFPFVRSNYMFEAFNVIYVYVITSMPRWFDDFSFKNFLCAPNNNCYTSNLKYGRKKRVFISFRTHNGLYGCHIQYEPSLLLFDKAIFTPPISCLTSKSGSYRNNKVYMYMQFIVWHLVRIDLTWERKPKK